MKHWFSKFIEKRKPWTLASHVARMPFLTQLYQYIYSKHLAGPRSVKIHLNSDCNYNCEYCYATKEKALVSTQKWLDFLNELSLFDIQTVEISGGEPLLFKDLGAILNKCSDAGYQVTIYTNGSLINQRFVGMIKQIDTQIIISIKYDCTAAYEKATSSGLHLSIIEKNIMFLVKNNIPVVAFITVNRSNLKHIKDTINRAIELGAFPVIERYVPVKDQKTNKRLCITANDWGYVLGLIKDVYREYNSLIDGVGRIQGRICSCYTTQFSVMQDGSVLPCQFLPNKMSIGNILEDNVINIWLKMQKQQEVWLKLPSDCIACKNKKLCSGGCRTYSYYLNSCFDKKDPLCNGNMPTTYGHCAFTVIHSFKQSKISSSKLRMLY
jgi:radical SAM protein with 4Fe4S-binding SPASM domain